LSIDQEKLFVNVETNGKSISEELFFKRIYTSGCGKGILYHNPVDLIQKIKLPLNFTISPEKILALMKKFQKSSLEFKKTGGVHSAALCNEKEILIFKDDIGRHNAVDKVIGEGIISEIDFTDKIILTSGRISSEILLKTNRCKIQIVASFSAPTDQSVRIARELNITLAGFVRGNRMNIYSGEERIK
jgi:FdhD protein